MANAINTAAVINPVSPNKASTKAKKTYVLNRIAPCITDVKEAGLTFLKKPMNIVNSNIATSEIRPVKTTSKLLISLKFAVESL